jgi:hypothetical protein
MKRPYVFAGFDWLKKAVDKDISTKSCIPTYMTHEAKIKQIVL